MLEDGGEVDNVFYRNLGAYTRRVQTLISDDETDDAPSTFWMTNPLNSWVDNVAAGSEGSGYWMELRQAVRGLSASSATNRDVRPKKLPLRRFVGNVAHSNAGHGVRTYPTGFQPPERAVLENVRSYRNGEAGAFFHNSRNLAVSGGVFADNRIQIDIDRARSVRVEGATVAGCSPQFRSAAEAQRARRAESRRPDDVPVVGVQLHTFRNSENDLLTGASISNVHFTDFEGTGCNNSVAINFDDEQRIGHFDYHTSFRNLSFAPGTTPFDLCAAEEAGLGDVVVTDVDSSMNPNPRAIDLGPPNSYRASSLVSDKPWMTAFLPDQCTSIPDACYAYCHHVCLRTITYRVDAYGTENVSLHVYDLPSHSRTLDVGGHFWLKTKRVVDDETGKKVRVPDSYESTRFSDHRYFSATLPAGSFGAEFRHPNGTSMWPSFVLTDYEEVPPCEGYLEDGSVTLTAPEVTELDCHELVKNGDAELGNYTYWYHSGGGVNVERGAGVGGSWALVSTRRDSERHGLATFLDTRGLGKMIGKEFEFEAKVRLEVAGMPFECDPGSESLSHACPQVSLVTQERDTVTKGVKRTYKQSEYHGIAKVLRVMDSDGWYTLHGSITISDQMADKDSAMIVIAQAKKEARIILDNVSLHAMPDRCMLHEDGEMVLNGNMENIDGRYWGAHGDVSLSIVSSAGINGTHALLASNRRDRDAGPKMDLLPKCFEEDMRYHVMAHFKLLKNARPVVCDKHALASSQFRCPEARLRITADGEDWYLLAGSTIEAGDGGSAWGVIHGMFTVPSQAVRANPLYLFLEGVAAGVDVLIDSVSLTSSEKNCLELIYNGDAEAGDTRGWKRLGGGSIGVIESGSSGSGHALIAKHRSSYDWGIAQYLETSCLHPGDVYVVSANVQLLHGINGTVLRCDPSILSGPECCPVATLMAEGNGYMYRNVARVTQMVDIDGWYYLHGIFEVFESDAAASSVMIHFQDAPKGIDIVLDNISIQNMSSERGR